MMGQRSHLLVNGLEDRCWKGPYFFVLLEISFSILFLFCSVIYGLLWAVIVQLDKFSIWLDKVRMIVILLCSFLVSGFICDA